MGGFPAHFTVQSLKTPCRQDAHIDMHKADVMRLLGLRPMYYTSVHGTFPLIHSHPRLRELQNVNHFKKITGSIHWKYLCSARPQLA